MIEIARDRIKQAKKNGWASLDLSGLNLTELPKELFELTRLTKLVLGKYRTPQKNYIKMIPKEISYLTALEVLDLTDNQVSDLPSEIIKLTNLKRLVLSSNAFTTLPESVCDLLNLEELFIGNNNISKLPSELKKLSKVHTLRLNNSKFLSIPDEINLLPALKHLFIFGNPIKNVSKELIGISSKEDVYPIVKQWFLDKNEGESFIYEAKLILVGEAEAGKTSLSKKLRNPKYELDRTEPMTKGIEVRKWEFPYDTSQLFCTNIWDFGGQDIMHATHRYFLTERSLYVLVVDIRAEKTDFYYWLNIIELFSAKSPVVIVMNEKHAYKKELSHSIRERFKDTIVGIYEVNLKNNQGLETLNHEIKEELRRLPHIGKEKMLNKWLNIRNALQASDKDFISFEDYEKIAKQFGIQDTEQATRIAKILHELGVILHFQNDAILRNTIILNKSWATEAVYLVLLDKKVTNNFGKVTFTDLDRIWKSYHFSKRIHLIQLMINFLLCYEVEKNTSYIVPQLLPENPTHIDYNQYFKEPSLYFRFFYPKFMPKGIISQLIVKMNKYIYDSLQWKSGVVLKMEDTFVEITEDFFDRRIHIQVAGKHKRNVLTIIRNEINEVNENFDKLEPVEEIPCGCAINIEEEKPFFMKRNVLDKYKIKGEKTIKCDVCLNNLRVLQLLDAVIGDENYTDELKLEAQKEKDEAYILDLMRSENNEVEFKATFLTPVYSKADKIFLEEYSKKLEKAEQDNDSKTKESLKKRKSDIEAGLKTPEKTDIVIHSVIKTLVAFANSNGGELVIGIDEHIDNTPYVFGIQRDIEKMKNSKDEFIKKFDEIIEKQIDNSFFALIKQHWIPIQNKEVLLIKVKASTETIFCKKEKNGAEFFYIRREGSTIELKGREFATYIKTRF